MKPCLAVLEGPHSPLYVGEGVFEDRDRFGPLENLKVWARTAGKGVKNGANCKENCRGRATIDGVNCDDDSRLVY